jgi:hypothetical protein
MENDNETFPTIFKTTQHHNNTSDCVQEAFL